MLRYIGRRLLRLIPILLAVIVIIFTINFCTPGSPAISILGGSATPEKLAEVEHEMGLDRPYFVQLGEYLWNIITKFDFGTSYSFKRPVMEVIGERIGVTCLLGFLSVIVTVIIGIPIGIIAAVKQNRPVDYIATTIAVVLAALPSFWLGLMLILLFSVNLKVLPISGLGTPAHWILPVFTVAAFPLANIVRMTRSSMLEVIRQDYVRTARAKGLPQREVLAKHVLPNGMIPVATTVGMMLGLSMTGTIIVETIFNIPGLGTLLNTSINMYDYNLTQGIVVVCAVIICCANLLTDIVYAFLDPRIKALYTNSGKRKKRSKDTRYQSCGEGM